MTFFGAALATAIATIVLAVFAIVTARYARSAFIKQSQEVTAIEQQVKDEQEVTRQQAELLKVQSEQLELQRQQLEDQRKASATQAEVLELQARDLRKSLQEREREAKRRVREQARFVYLTETRHEGVHGGPLDSEPPSILAVAVNTSNQPVYEAAIYYSTGDSPHGEPENLGVIPPGQKVPRTREYPPGTDISTCHAQLTFRDADGIVFVRRPDGYLEDLVVPVREGSLNAAYRRDSA